jgi:prepilin peptidase CpaA
MAEFVLLAWALAAVVFDLRQRRLPNALTLGAAAVGAGLLLLNGESLLGIPPGQVWQGAGLAMLLTLPAYALHLLGAGDVKLAMASALLTGLYPFILVYVLAAFLALGGLLMVRYVQYLPYGYRLYPGGNAGERPAGHGRTVPFGAALGAALAGVMLARLLGWPG